MHVAIEFQFTRFRFNYRISIYNVQI